MKKVFFIYSDKNGNHQCHGSYKWKWRALLAINGVLRNHKELKREDVFIFVEDDEEVLSNGVIAENKYY